MWGFPEAQRSEIEGGWQWPRELRGKVQQVDKYIYFFYVANSDWQRLFFL